jgi:uncharacterized membrane protein YkvA (DUF1232 family)
MLFGKFSVMLKLLRSSEVSWKDKLPIIGLIVYIISPVDLIPYPILGFSIVDDLVVFGLLINLVNRSIKKYSTTNSKGVDPEHVVSDVDYEVEDVEDVEDIKDDKNVNDDGNDEDGQ